MAVRRLAERINGDYAGREDVLFLVVLNGAFMFAADLLGELEFDGEVAFVRLSSYRGTGSTGEVKELLGLDCSVERRHVVVIEDIVDTGTSMKHLTDELQARGAASVDIAVMFFKPSAFRYDYPVRYVAMELPNDFIVGYGLDYDGLGRNYRDIYSLSDERG